MTDIKSVSVEDLIAPPSRVSQGEILSETYLVRFKKTQKKMIEGAIRISNAKSKNTFYLIALLEKSKKIYEELGTEEDKKEWAEFVKTLQNR